MRDRDHAKLPTGRELGLLSLVIIGIGTSGPVIALGTMPIVTLIFWRNLGGFLLVAPWADWRQVRKYFNDPKSRKSLYLAATAGLALALHFLGFFLSMRFTSVATGTALTALQPIFATLFVKLLGGKVPSRVWIAMFVAFTGVLSITGVDLQISTRAFVGDLAALLCAALSAAYVTIGANVRETLSTATYTSIVYFVCTLFALIASIIYKIPLVGYARVEWFYLLVLIVGAQILGHTILSFTLRSVSPAIASIVVFFEVPVSSLLAFWWLGQLPPLGTIPGLVIILIGCAIFAFRQSEKS